jgi:hypothetical protein
MWTFEVQLIFLTESVVVYRDVPGHPYLEVHVVDVLGDQVNELLSKTLIWKQPSIDACKLLYFWTLSIAFSFI